MDFKEFARVTLCEVLHPARWTFPFQQSILITYIFGYNRRYSVEKIENSTAVTGFHTNVGAPREAAMTALTTMNIPAAQRAFEVLPKWLELDLVKQMMSWVGNESINYFF